MASRRSAPGGSVSNTRVRAGLVAPRQIALDRDICLPCRHDGDQIELLAFRGWVGRVAEVRDRRPIARALSRHWSGLWMESRRQVGLHEQPDVAIGSQMRGGAAHDRRQSDAPLLSGARDRKGKPLCGPGCGRKDGEHQGDRGETRDPPPEEWAETMAEALLQVPVHRRILGFPTPTDYEHNNAARVRDRSNDRPGQEYVRAHHGTRCFAALTIKT